MRYYRARSMKFPFRFCLARYGPSGVPAQKMPPRPLPIATINDPRIILDNQTGWSICPEPIFRLAAIPAHGGFRIGVTASLPDGCLAREREVLAMAFDGLMRGLHGNPRLASFLYARHAILALGADCTTFIFTLSIGDMSGKSENVIFSGEQKFPTSELRRRFR